MTEPDVFLGEGKYGRVFKRGNTVIKISKHSHDYQDFCREMRFYAWIATLVDRTEQRHFARFISHRIHQDQAGEWWSEITSEYKGVPLSLDHPDARTRYKLLTQILIIVQIMKKHHVVHEDMHIGNFVVDNGVVALIDYGFTHLQSQDTAERDSENEMMFHVTDFMGNWDPINDEMERLGTVMPPRKLFLDAVKDAAPETYRSMREFVKLYNYSFSRPTNYSHIHVPYNTCLDFLRVFHPDLLLMAMGIKSAPPPFFSAEDYMDVYKYWDNINELVRIFRAKAES
jgi:hypothetical protein